MGACHSTHQVGDDQTCSAANHPDALQRKSSHSAPRAVGSGSSASSSHLYQHKGMVGSGGVAAAGAAGAAGADGQCHPPTEMVGVHPSRPSTAITREMEQLTKGLERCLTHSQRERESGTRTPSEATIMKFMMATNQRQSITVDSSSIPDQYQKRRTFDSQFQSVVSDAHAAATTARSNRSSIETLSVHSISAHHQTHNPLSPSTEKSKFGFSAKRNKRLSEVKAQSEVHFDKRMDEEPTGMASTSQFLYPPATSKVDHSIQSIHSISSRSRSKHSSLPPHSPFFQSTLTAQQQKSIEAAMLDLPGMTNAQTADDLIIPPIDPLSLPHIDKDKYVTYLPPVINHLKHEAVCETPIKRETPVPDVPKLFVTSPSESIRAIVTSNNGCAIKSRHSAQPSISISSTSTARSNPRLLRQTLSHSTSQNMFDTMIDRSILPAPVSALIWVPVDLRQCTSRSSLRAYASGRSTPSVNRSTMSSASSSGPNTCRNLAPAYSTSVAPQQTLQMTVDESTETETAHQSSFAVAESDLGLSMAELSELKDPTAASRMSNKQTRAMKLGSQQTPQTFVGV